MAAANETPKSPGDRFPALKPLEESVERAKLRQALAEANAAELEANLPSLDVEIQHDAVVMSDKTTGLARVLVQLDSLTLADDIADRALDSAFEASDAGKRSYAFLVVSDPTVFKDVDAHRLLSAELKRLTERVEAYLPEIQDEAIPALVPALIGIGVQAVGLMTKLLAREYTLSGTQVTVDDLGFDLQVAHALRKESKRRKDENVRVDVDRLRPTPEQSTILASIQQLAESADRKLAAKLSQATRELDLASAAVASADAEVETFDNQILELLKRIPEKIDGTSSAKVRAPTYPILDELQRLNAEREKVRKRTPALRKTLAEKRETHDRGAALATDITAFITSALAAGTNARPPAIQAARAEALLASSATDRRFILYARLLAGGVDQEVERKIGADRYLVVAGATAEYALLSVDGLLLASETISLLEGSTMKLLEPDSFKRERMYYMDFHRKHLNDRVPA